MHSTKFPGSNKGRQGDHKPISSWCTNLVQLTEPVGPRKQQCPGQLRCEPYSIEKRNLRVTQQPEREMNQELDNLKNSREECNNHSTWVTLTFVLIFQCIKKFDDPTEYYEWSDHRTRTSYCKIRKRLQPWNRHLVVLILTQIFVLGYIQRDQCWHSDPVLSYILQIIQRVNTNKTKCCSRTCVQISELTRSGCILQNSTDRSKKSY
jgi:hypothetical protein